MRWYRDPLLHFLLIGAGLFVVNTAIRQNTKTDAAGRIVITAADVDRLRESWTRNRGRRPTDAEMRLVLEHMVREEVLFREAMRLGLADEDTVVRHRMVAKMEFLNSSVAEQAEPVESDLRAFFTDRRENYQSSPTISFEHVYFDRDLRGDAAFGDARRTLSALRSDPSAPAHADAFDGEIEYALQTSADVQRVFGKRFADAVFALGVDMWQGPLESDRGVHLVRVLEKLNAAPSDFERVRERVLRDWRVDRRRTAEAEAYERLRETYHIVIEAPRTESDGG